MATIGIIAWEAEIMNAWRQALEDSDVKDAYNVDRYINIEEKQSELDPERTQATEYLTRQSAMHLKVRETYDRGWHGELDIALFCSSVGNKNGTESD